MSGGHFDGWSHYRLEEISEEIKSRIKTENIEVTNENGEFLGTMEKSEYSADTNHELLNAINIIQQASIYIKRIDWLLSGDDGEESFQERLREELEDLETKN